MRGEKTEDKAELCEVGGSPPHARGKGPLPRQTRQGGGITPACAGKRSLLDSVGAAQGDHPRMRGEKIRLARTGYTALGSPPHARGKGVCCLISFYHKRITPACAGKRPSFRWCFYV